MTSTDRFMLFASSESEAKYSATCCSYPCDIMECVDCDRVNGDSDLQVELFGFLAVGEWYGGRNGFVLLRL